MRSTPRAPPLELSESNVAASPRLPFVNDGTAEELTLDPVLEGEVLTRFTGACRAYRGRLLCGDLRGTETGAVVLG